MRVLVVADDLAGETLDPASVWLHELGRRWARRGPRLLALCAGGRPAGPLSSAGDPPGMTVLRPPHEEFEAALGEALADLPDLVHVMGCGPFGSRVTETLRGVPLLLDVHDFWPICPAKDLFQRPRLAGCPEHFPYEGCEACAGPARIEEMAERSTLAAAARVLVTHSAFARARLESVLARPVERLGYGVDTLRFRPDPEPPRTAAIRDLFERTDVPRVLLLGAPTTPGGAAVLVDILVGVHARVPDVEMVVAGGVSRRDGWEARLRPELRELGLEDRLVCLSHVPPEDLPALFASCRVGIAPGEAPEPGGLFLLMALSAALPIVAHPAEGARDLLRPETARLIPADDVPKFADAVGVLLTDRAAREGLGQRGRLEAMERHDLERSVYRLEELYREVAAGTQGREAA